MDDLIKRKDAIDAIKKAYWDSNLQSAKDDPCVIDAMTDWAIRQIKGLPSASTTDAVKHGEWHIEEMNTYDLAYGCTGYEPRYRCSCCGMITESYLRTEKPIMPEDASFPDYCPNCGAKMDVTDINVGDKMDGE